MSQAPSWGKILAAFVRWLRENHADSHRADCADAAARATHRVPPETAPEAAEPFRYRAHARVDRVYDGDTFFGRHRPDPTTIVAMDESQRNDPNDDAGQYYRLSGVDTHELRSGTAEEREMAKEERDFVISWIETGTREHEAEGHESWPFVLIYASEKYHGSFGRPLCDLIRKSDGEHLSSALLDAFADRDLVYHGAAPETNGHSEPASVREIHPERDTPPVGLPWAASPGALR